MITNVAVLSVRYALKPKKQLSIEAVIKTRDVSESHFIAKVITVNDSSVSYVLRAKKQLSIEDVIKQTTEHQT
jgi:hypothetical protein